jgi:hypothetical protein
VRGPKNGIFRGRSVGLYPTWQAKVASPPVPAGLGFHVQSEKLLAPYYFACHPGALHYHEQSSTFQHLNLNLTVEGIKGRQRTGRSIGKAWQREEWNA